MRLRGEVGLLRRQTNSIATLLAENQRLRHALTDAGKTAQSPESDPQREAEKQIGIAKMNDAKTLALGVLLYAEQHGGLTPTNYQHIINQIPAVNQTLTGTNQFDLIYSGSLKELSAPQNIIVLRERDALPQPGGGFMRAYGFADGHAEYHYSPDGDFESWENKHIAPAAP